MSSHIFPHRRVVYHISITSTPIMNHQNDLMQNEHNHYENNHCGNYRNMLYYEIYQTHIREELQNE